MDMANGQWELRILDADPPAHALAGLAVGDVDGDGHVEVVVGGVGGLFAYRVDTLERFQIADGLFTVGATLDDLDGDGHLEVIVGLDRTGANGDNYSIAWFKAPDDLSQPWTRYMLDSSAVGYPHDILLTDLDGDGENELVANAINCATPGLYIYKRTGDLTTPWRRHLVHTNIFIEGLVAADLDGDGRVEIVCGPDCFSSPPDGPFSGPWERQPLAPGMREMCRTALVDITGDGRLDVVMVESEFEDGRFSWFENRTREDPAHPWIEHPIEDGLYYAHSLSAYRDQAGIQIFLGEMSQGGWEEKRNRHSRLLSYRSLDQGRSWQRTRLYEGEGTHEATLYDIDGDGQLEIVGKDWCEHFGGGDKTGHAPKVQIWKQCQDPSPLTHVQHRFLDRDKPGIAIDMISVDIDGDGRQDIVCGSWWYQNTTWKRFEIPGIYQIINAYDLDGDGRQELIGIKANPQETEPYKKLSSDLYWLKPIDPERGVWEEYSIGVGSGDWPHGSAVAPLLPNDRLALVIGYHSTWKQGDRPEIFEMPADPRQSPWPRRVLADISYGEEFAVCDLDGDGKLDLVAGMHWLENMGDGTFRPHSISDESFESGRLHVTDMNGDGKLDIILGEHTLDYSTRKVPLSRLAWFEQPSDPRQGNWKMHVIDTVRCAHSIDGADLDGDGEIEIVCGEHDPFHWYRNQCHLYVYKKADTEGKTWKRYTLDDRFEHHDGAKVFEAAPGKLAIASHGWQESHYVHLWEV